LRCGDEESLPAAAKGAIILMIYVRAEQAAEKLAIGRERRTSGANARCGETARRIFIVYGTTKVVP
jgi:hypothetical protein